MKLESILETQTRMKYESAAFPTAWHSPRLPYCMHIVGSRHYYKYMHILYEYTRTCPCVLQSTHKTHILCLLCYLSTPCPFLLPYTGEPKLNISHTTCPTGLFFFTILFKSSLFHFHRVDIYRKKVFPIHIITLK